MDPAAPAGPIAPLTLHATQRRVLGVLIEKGLATPEYYPMTVNALVAGCNQKNNRDPLTQLSSDEVETTLKELDAKGLALSVIGDTGRVVRWRQELARKWELSAVELAVLGELLLRGAQSEGDLRARASRMRPIEALDALRVLLDKLRVAAPSRPVLVVRLTPEGSARGVRWTHALHSAEQLKQLFAEEAASNGEVGARTNVTLRNDESASPATTVDLLARVKRLEERVAQLEAMLLKHA